MNEAFLCEVILKIINELKEHTIYRNEDYDTLQR